MPDREPGRQALVLVSGSGRSGTSTVAGTLKKLGLAVPQPEIAPDETNPRGYFEPAWVVDFQKRTLADAEVKTNDARPDAASLVHPALVERRDELERWLRGQLDSDLAGRDVVVKDPRSFWLMPLWREVVDSVGLRLSSLTMLRHPAEVAGSRELHYLKGADEELRRAREVGNVAGWLNAVLIQEDLTRDMSRTFVPYADLISDWRAAASRIATQLQLPYDVPAPSQHHEVDDFIDANLRRSQRQWSDLDVPVALVDLAETTWQAMNALVSDPADAAALRDIDAAREGYAELHRQAAAIVQDDTAARVRQARRETRRKLNQKHRAQLAELGRGPGDTAHTARRAVRKALGRLRGPGG
ncbi:sulfotransferase [Nocardioides marmoribigeumensis]